MVPVLFRVFSTILLSPDKTYHVSDAISFHAFTHSDHSSNQDQFPVKDRNLLHAKRKSTSDQVVSEVAGAANSHNKDQNSQFKTPAQPKPTFADKASTSKAGSNAVGGKKPLGKDKGKYTEETAATAMETS